MSKASISPCIPYNVPPAIPLSAWQPVPKGLRWMLERFGSRTSRFKVGPSHQGHYHLPESIQLSRGEYLHFAEPVGPYRIVACSFIPGGYFVAQFFRRSGRVLRAISVCPPRDVDWGPDSLSRRREWAILTAEAAVLALKERRAGRSKKGEAWLRRQLEELEKESA